MEIMIVINIFNILYESFENNCIVEYTTMLLNKVMHTNHVFINRR